MRARGRLPFVVVAIGVVIAGTASASNVSIRASNGGPNTVDRVHPTDDFFAGPLDGGSFVASADIASGVLRALAFADGGATFGSNTHAAAGQIDLLSITNVSGSDIVFPYGSVMITVTSQYGSLPGPGPGFSGFEGGFIGHTTTAGFNIVGLGGLSVRHEVLSELDIGGNVLSLPTSNVLLADQGGVDSDIDATVTGIFFTAVFEEFTLPDNGRLDFAAHLRVNTNAANANTTTTTDASSSAELSILLPEGVDPNDLVNDAGVELSWIVPEPGGVSALALGLAGLVVAARLRSGATRGILPPGRRMQTTGTPRSARR